jgi:hypothetical protein
LQSQVPASSNGRGTFEVQPSTCSHRALSNRLYRLDAWDADGE